MTHVKYHYEPVCDLIKYKDILVIMRSYLFYNYMIELTWWESVLMKIGYYFIITNDNQFDGHWLYKDIGICLCSIRVLHSIPSIKCVE